MCGDTGSVNCKTWTLLGFINVYVQQQESVRVLGCELG